MFATGSPSDWVKMKQKTTAKNKQAVWLNFTSIHTLLSFSPYYVEDKLKYCWFIPLNAQSDMKFGYAKVHVDP